MDAPTHTATVNNGCIPVLDGLPLEPSVTTRAAILAMVAILRYKFPKAAKLALFVGILPATKLGGREREHSFKSFSIKFDHDRDRSVGGLRSSHIFCIRKTAAPLLIHLSRRMVDGFFGGSVHFPCLQSFFKLSFADSCAALRGGFSAKFKWIFTGTPFRCEALTLWRRRPKHPSPPIAPRAVKFLVRRGVA